MKGGWGVAVQRFLVVLFAIGLPALVAGAQFLVLVFVLRKVKALRSGRFEQRRDAQGGTCFWFRMTRTSSPG